MKRIISLLILLSPVCAVAEPYVIFDSGQGVPTRHYTQILAGENTSDIRESWIFKEVPNAKIEPGLDPKSAFPITTTKLTPQKITTQIDSYFTVMAFPICIVGTDKLSREWIKQNKKHLLDISAHCLLVEAPNVKKAQFMLNLMKGIIVFPANGDAIAEHYKIEHYPVLITERYISQ